MKDTLYKFHTNVFIVGLLMMGFLTALATDRSVHPMTFAPFVAFVTQMALMLHFSKEGQMDFSENTLVITVLLYFILMGTFFMLISLYIDGDTFLFSKVDAMFYYRESMKAANQGLPEGILYLTRTYHADDWGALVFDAIIMSIISNKLLLNLVYVILATISSLYLFRIGKAFMPESYAFLATLAYSTSSFSVYYNCTFLKESVFLFLVVSVFYHLYQAITCGSRSAFFAIGIYTIAIAFFRPAVIAFIAASIFIYYGIKQKGTAISLFLYGAALGVFAVSLTAMQDIFNNHTHGGNLDGVSNEISNKSYSSNFNFFVSYFGACLGPFPSLFPKEGKPSAQEFLAAGLVYKLFVAVPFWYGVYMAIKKRVTEMAPLLVFVLMELFITGAILASLELRKVIIHVPFMYILSFYGMYHGFVPYKLTRISGLPIFLFAIGVMVLWNLFKVKA